MRFIDWLWRRQYKGKLSTNIETELIRRLRIELIIYADNSRLKKESNCKSYRSGLRSITVYCTAAENNIMF
jgi:hypothetical protein